METHQAKSIMGRPRKSTTKSIPQRQAPTNPVTFLPGADVFRTAIEELMAKHECSRLDAIVYWADSKNLCPSELGELVRRCGADFLQALKEEAGSLNLLKRVVND